mmetsp:Transcript_46982/g.102239  ORF Transcript_46982/g.102239 Transcript_46982/m.102239 type:complete len:528 (-) Transcript_46982:7-1590(-)
MDRQAKVPRANRSKKNLPAAFCNGNPTPDGGRAAVGCATGEGWVAGAGRAPSEADTVSLDSLVFLGCCPQREGRLALKKMLHPPTLGLFCLVELPGTDNQRSSLRASLQDWLQRWQELQAERPELMVAVRETFWDAPQGYPMGILCEYMPLGSLDELLRACGGLPEEAMREIAQVVLEALNVLHTGRAGPLVHGCLKPTQVLFGTNGLPRLTLGLEQRLKGYQVREGSESAPSEKQSPAVDIFDLGLLLLVSALGGLDVLLDAIPYARTYGGPPMQEPSSPPVVLSNDTCLLLQHELGGSAPIAAAADSPAFTAAGAFSGSRGKAAIVETDAAAGAGGAGMGYLPPATDLLFNRQYSEPFISFVATCLEAHTRPDVSITARDLLEHEFLSSPATSAGPMVSLREMQELARLLNEAPEHDPNRLGPVKSTRSLVAGIAPSVAQSAQLYLRCIAESIAPHCSRPPRRSSSDDERTGSVLPHVLHGYRQRPEWESLLVDTARTLGLPRAVVEEALEAQVLHLAQSSSYHQ